MADSIRMIDVGALTRGLDEFRRLDPEHRVLAHRLATQAAVRRVEESHQDVEGPDESEEARLRRRDPDDERGGTQRDGHQAASGEEQEPEPVPERDEGRLLDIKV